MRPVDESLLAGIGILSLSNHRHLCIRLPIDHRTRLCLQASKKDNSCPMGARESIASIVKDSNTSVFPQTLAQLLEHLHLDHRNSFANIMIPRTRGVNFDQNGFCVPDHMRCTIYIVRTVSNIAEVQLEDSQPRVEG